MESDNIYLNGDYYNRRLLILECDSSKWGLYESIPPFAWCPWNTVSYILARPMNLKSYTKLAGICYDIQNMSPTALYYTMSPRHIKDKHPEALAKYGNLHMEEIKHVSQIFRAQSITADMYDKQQFKNWIQFANYNFSSIIQNPTLYRNVYGEFAALLDFAWWSNLRLGNWRHYETSLATHIENDNISFDILTGISGSVMAPVKVICENNYTMKELLDSTNRKIPLYVWSYLQPTIAHNSSDEVVVIGLNTPFYDFYAEEDVIFCQDICSQIDWLKNVRSLFRYSTMGIVFCCSVEEVKSSNRLEGFPKKLSEPSQAPETTPLPYILAEQTTPELLEDGWLRPR